MTQSVKQMAWNQLVENVGGDFDKLVRIRFAPETDENANNKNLLKLALLKLTEAQIRDMVFFIAASPENSNQDFIQALIYTSPKDIFSSALPSQEQIDPYIAAVREHTENLAKPESKRKLNFREFLGYINPTDAELEKFQDGVTKVLERLSAELNKLFGSKNQGKQ